MIPIFKVFIPTFVEMRDLCILLLFLFKYAYATPIATSHFSMNINMPDVRPQIDDDYLCTAKKLNSVESYIIQYEPDADGRTAHHMLLFGCQGLQSQSHLYPKYWTCGGDLCSQMTIMYGWAKNAQSMKLPPKVGFLVGGNSSIQYLVLQVHYAKALQDGVTDNTGLKLHMTTERQPYITRIHLLMAYAGQIPPYRSKYSIDVNCKYKSNVPIHVFAYRVHTHKLGTVVSGYKFNIDNGSWTMLAKGNPQWPQAFYPMEHQLAITNKDILAAKCTYNSSAMSVPVSIGSLSSDEMCNLYLMYYTEYRNRNLKPVSPCVGVEYNDLVPVLPVGNDVPLPINEALEHRAQSAKYHDTEITYGNVETEGLHPSLGPTSSHQHISPGEKLYSEHMSNDKYTDINDQFHSDFKYQVIHGWPSKLLKFGQIAAVALDKNGNVFILHRGSHVWDSLSFDYYNNYQQPRDHPIKEPTVISLDPISGMSLEQWGANLFFMPHGLTLDLKGRYWITDVALHQVFCFDENKEKPTLTLGEKFIPGNDELHFCKPTSIAISSSGEIYVADGYCNSRIIRFSPDGKFINQFGKADNPLNRSPPVGTFYIPHKVVLLEDRDLVCVADRENGRIQCFTMVTGNFRFKIEIKEFGGRVFSIAYTKGLLYAVSGEATYHDHPVKAFVFNATDQKLLSIFAPKSGTFSAPHDIAVSADSEEVYVCEIGPNVVWKFVQDFHKSTKKVLESEEADENLSRGHLPSQHMADVQVVHTNSEVNDHSKVVEDDVSNFETSMIIMALLSIPVLLLILITVAIRLRRRGTLQSCSFGHFKGWLGGYRTPHPQEKFNLGNFLNPHKGFDKVALEESDGEEEGSASDVEEFNTTNKA